MDTEFLRGSGAQVKKDGFPGGVSTMMPQGLENPGRFGSNW